jgi:hypothetical protein
MTITVLGPAVFPIAATKEKQAKGGFIQSMGPGVCTELTPRYGLSM